MELSNRKLIAVSGDRYLEETSPGQGRVIIPSQDYEGPIHSIASIAARGYWEPLIPSAGVPTVLPNPNEKR